MKNNLVDLNTKDIINKTKKLLKSKIKNIEILDTVYELIDSININGIEIDSSKIILKDTNKNDSLTIKLIYNNNSIEIQYNINEMYFKNLSVIVNTRQKSIIVNSEIMSENNKFWKLDKDIYRKNKLLERICKEEMLDENNKTIKKETTVYTVDEKLNVTREIITERQDREPLRSVFVGKINNPILYNSKRRKVVKSIDLNGSIDKDIIFSVLTNKEEKKMKKKK